MKYEMKLKNNPFNSIKNGTKTVEMRLYDEKRRLLRVNDLIEFTNIDSFEKMIVKVVGLYKFSSFEELYNYFDKVSLGYKENEEANSSDMEEYYSKDEQDKYGVVGIQIVRI